MIPASLTWDHWKADRRDAILFPQRATAGGVKEHYLSLHLVAAGKQDETPPGVTRRSSWTAQRPGNSFQPQQTHSFTRRPELIAVSRLVNVNWLSISLLFTLKKEVRLLTFPQSLAVIHGQVKSHMLFSLAFCCTAQQPALLDELSCFFW